MNELDCKHTYTWKGVVLNRVVRLFTGGGFYSTLCGDLVVEMWRMKPS